MYLKSLALHGFKSFAEKTTLTFPPPHAGRFGITAIVGPNGSGKSNIVDAIRWVMGEQSMKTLRGKKGSDIIFSGSLGKGRMGFAEVWMTMDNRDARMPVPYDEAVVGRRIDIHSESVYTVNGNPVRLFDLQVLLAQAQFGHGSYGTIGQGMIERLLLHTPVERKEFFDEACGIKEFQIKRHQASLKLDRTRAHMAEAELLLAEISPRLKTLTRQVKKLEERQEIEIKLRELQESYYVTLWQEEASALAAVRGAQALLEKELLALRASLDAKQEETEALAFGESHSGRFEELQRRYEARVEEKQCEVRDLESKLNAAYARAGKQDIGWIMSKRESARAAAAAAREAREAAEHETKEVEARVENLETQASIARERRETLRREVAEIEAQTLPIEARAVEAVLADQERFGTVYGIVAHLARPVDEEYTLALDVAAGAHLLSIVTEDDRVAERWIRYLREARIGVATFLPRAGVKPRIPPHDVLNMLRHRAVKGLAADLIRYDEKFSTIFSFIFGATLVVDSIQDAREIGIGRIRMVTLAGDLIETSGSMKGGFRQRKSAGASFAAGAAVRRPFTGAASLSLMRRELEALEAAYGKEEEALRAAYRAMEIARGREVALAYRERELGEEHMRMEDEYALTTAEPSRADAVRADMRARQEAITRRVAELDRAIREAQKDMRAFQAGEEAHAARMISLQREAQAQEEAFRRLTEEKHARDVEGARAETKAEDIAREAAQELREDVRAPIVRGVAARDRETLPGLLQEIQKMKYALSLIGGIDDAIVEEYRQTSERHGGLSAQLEDLGRAMEDLTTLIRELDDMMKKKRAESFRKIRKEFSRFFTMLFGGGSADLVEVHGTPEDEESEEADIRSPISDLRSPNSSLMGIDIKANPPGKKIGNIHALSGGERTIVALALLSAILHTNPPPFVVLDEVEAALDEANTVRFGGILQELATLSQCILITHNRATMHIADTLYGVTMGGDGLSRLVSVKLPGE